VKDEKHIKSFFNYLFFNVLWGRRFSSGKDCAVDGTRLFRVRPQGQDKFYPKKNGWY
jgi:hypothetical protein